MTASFVQRHNLRSWLLPLLWIVLTAALLIALPRLPWQEALDHASRAALPWILAAIALNLLILPLWALEWRLLVPGGARVAFGRMFGIVSVTASVLNSIPFLVGEASAVALLIGRAGLSRGAALSLLAMDQLLVAFAKVAVLVAALAVAPVPSWVRGGLLSLATIFAFMLAAMLVLAHRWEQMRDRLRDAGSRVAALWARAAALGAHLEMLRDPGLATRVAALALAKKLAEVAAAMAIQAAFGMEPSLVAALMVVAALSLSTLVPIAPANLGIYEATVFAIYRYLGLPADLALGLSILQHLCFLVPSVATGYVIATMKQLRLRSRQAG